MDPNGPERTFLVARRSSRRRRGQGDREERRLHGGHVLANGVAQDARGARRLADGIGV